MPESPAKKARTERCGEFYMLRDFGRLPEDIQEKCRGYKKEYTDAVARIRDGSYNTLTANGAFIGAFRHDSGSKYALIIGDDTECAWADTVDELETTAGHYLRFKVVAAAATGETIHCEFDEMRIRVVDAATKKEVAVFDWREII